VCLLWPPGATGLGLTFPKRICLNFHLALQIMGVQVCDSWDRKDLAALREEETHSSPCPVLLYHRRFQKLHLACGSERLILRSPLQPLISLCEAPASPLQLPGGNVTITYSYAGARAPMGQGFLLSYNQGRLDRSVQAFLRGCSGSLRAEGRFPRALGPHSPSP
jgi:hypothetical protein